MKKRPTRKQPTYSKTARTYLRKGKEVTKSLAHGTPGLYNKKAHDGLAFRFMLLGCTEEEVAKHLGINYTTYNDWKNKHESFAQAIIDGGEDADARVAQSLFERAQGYDYNEETIRREKDGEVTRITHKKSLPADIRAAEIWLRNRTNARKRWTKTTEDEEQIPPPPAPMITINNQTIDVTKLSDTALRELIAAVGAGPTQP